MDQIRLLIVDNEGAVRSMIIQHAASEGYLCDEAADGITAIKLFRRNDYHAIVLDTELPELDGRNVLRHIRKVSDVPVIVLTRRGREEDRLCGFQLGADDYMVKPFSVQELIARIKVFLRRSGSAEKDIPEKISFGGLYIDAASRTVYIDDQPVPLSPKEYDLLFFLSQNPNKVFARDMLLNQVWGFDFFGSDRTVDTHIKALRKSIKPYDQYIVTVWGYGYKFVL